MEIFHIINIIYNTQTNAKDITLPNHRNSTNYVPKAQQVIIRGEERKNPKNQTKEKLKLWFVKITTKLILCQKKKSSSTGF